MEDEFYSVLKLVSGEELMAKVCPCYEDDRIVLILDNPVVIKDIIITKSGMRAYRVEPWIKVIEDEMFFINMDKVITMTEVSDIHTLRMYKRYLRENCNQEGTSRISSSKSMGYISSVSEFKNTLENLYKSS